MHRHHSDITPTSVITPTSLTVRQLLSDNARRPRIVKHCLIQLRQQSDNNLQSDNNAATTIRQCIRQRFDNPTFRQVDERSNTDEACPSNERVRQTPDKRPTTPDIRRSDNARQMPDNPTKRPTLRQFRQTGLCLIHHCARYGPGSAPKDYSGLGKSVKSKASYLDT